MCSVASPTPCANAAQGSGEVIRLSTQQNVSGHPQLQTTSSYPRESLDVYFSFHTSVNVKLNSQGCTCEGLQEP